jgi:hypothetical protein
VNKLHAWSLMHLLHHAACNCNKTQATSMNDSRQAGSQACMLPHSLEQDGVLAAPGHAFAQVQPQLGARIWEPAASQAAAGEAQRSRTAEQRL